MQGQRSKQKRHMFLFNRVILFGIFMIYLSYFLYLLNDVRSHFSHFSVIPLRSVHFWLLRSLMSCILSYRMAK